jgi:hypothetical protein
MEFKRRVAMPQLGVVAGTATAVAVALIAFANPVQAATDPTVWAANGHSYAVVPAPNITWPQARAAATGLTNGGSICPGHLATVTSAEENDFLKSTFGTDLVTKWLGGIQSPSAAVSDGWSWITGEPWSFSDWGTTEPNNGFYPGYGYEDALEYYAYGDQIHWNGAPQTWDQYASGGYVVEYDCRAVPIDVMPGSSTNPINSDGNGVIPVAILSTPDFDASTVDASTVSLDGQAVRLKGKSGTSGSLEDVNGDGLLDLVVQIVDTDGTYADGSTVATVTAKTTAGESIKGTDTITVVP